MDVVTACVMSTVLKRSSGGDASSTSIGVPAGIVSGPTAIVAGTIKLVATGANVAVPE